MQKFVCVEMAARSAGEGDTVFQRVVNSDNITADCIYNIVHPLKKTVL